MEIELLTKMETAHALKVSLRTVDYLIARGALKAIRPVGSRCVRVEPDELRRFIDAARAQANPSAA